MEVYLKITQEFWLRPKKDSCEHDWEPAFTAAYNKFEIILFPGRRCKKCLKGEKCIPEQEQAQRDFEESFGMSFEVYLQSRRPHLIKSMAQDTRILMIAEQRDYRLLA